MRLYILRHANAETEAATDSARELSEKGREQAHKVAQFCARHGIRPDVIFASPLVRAQQTAKPVAKELGMEITTAPWLSCGATPEGILAKIPILKDPAAVMLVGHEPDLGELIAHLLGGVRGSINVRKASLTFIEVMLPRMGGGRLEFSIPARMM
ncbi:MAG: phosphohistidine phosphatase SixA [Chthoniobacteraceae bacterium]